MEPLKESSRHHPSAGRGRHPRLREPPHNFEAEQALAGRHPRSTMPPISESPSSCAPNTSPTSAWQALRLRSTRLIERGQVVERRHAQDLRRAGRRHEGSRRRGLSRAAGRGLRARDRRRRLRPGGARPLPAPPAHRSRRERRERRLRPATSRRPRCSRSRSPRRSSTTSRQTGQTEGGFKPFRMALTEAMVGGRGGLWPRGQAHRRGHAACSTSISCWAACTGPTCSSSPAAPRWERRRSPPTSPSTPRRPTREEIVDGHPKAVDGAVVGFFSLEMSCRTARHPHALRAGRNLVGKDPQGRDDQPATSTGSSTVSHELEHLQLLHRRHAGAVHRGAAHARPPPEAHRTGSA